MKKNRQGQGNGKGKNKINGFREPPLNRVACRVSGKIRVRARTRTWHFLFLCHAYLDLIILVSPVEFKWATFGEIYRRGLSQYLPD
jgi:hypothetical protein